MFQNIIITAYLYFALESEQKVLKILCMLRLPG